MPEYQENHELNALHRWVEKFAARYGQLAFPAEILLEMTEEDISCLGRFFDLPHMPHRWCDGLFEFVNEKFIEDGKNSDFAKQTLFRLASEGVPKAPLFLMAVEAYKAQWFHDQYLLQPKRSPITRKGPLIDLEFEDSSAQDLIRQHSERILQPAEMLKERLGELRCRQRELRERGYGPVDMLTESCDWIAETFEQQLDELIRRIRVEEQESLTRISEANKDSQIWRDGDALYLRFGSTPKRNCLDARVYKALDGIVQLLENRGVVYPVKKARMLLDGFGIQATDEGVRTARAARRRREEVVG